jgi:CRP/FNR family transcriptional activator FtrB
VSAVRESVPHGLIMREGQPADHLHIVLDGTVELYGTCGQKESTIDVLKAGDSFILAAVVKDAPYLMSARSLTRSRILEIPGKAFRAALRRDQGLALATSFELSRAFRAKVRQLRGQKLRTAQMRLAGYLMGEIGDVTDPRRLFLRVSKTTLASLMGLEPESLSRVFASLRPHGVEVMENKIVVNDPCKLKELAIYNSILDDPD